MKKTLAVLLVLVMTMAAVPGALADTVYNHGNSPATHVCPVYANVAISYTITIPTYIDFGTLKKTDIPQKRDLTITVADIMVDNGAGLRLYSNSALVLKNGNLDELPFTVTNNNNNVTFFPGGVNIPFTALATLGTVTAQVNVNPAAIQYAGAYKGTIEFGFEYLPKNF